MFGSGFQFQFSKENKVILLRPTSFFFFQLELEFDEFSESIFIKLR